jgi:Immunoglobulin I-set domain
MYFLQALLIEGDLVAEYNGSTARLTILQVYPEDEGEYTCVARNDLGKVNTSACLIVDGESFGICFFSMRGSRGPSPAHGNKKRLKQITTRRSRIHI